MEPVEPLHCGSTERPQRGLAERSQRVLAEPPQWGVAERLQWGVAELPQWGVAAVRGARVEQVPWPLTAAVPTGPKPAASGDAWSAAPRRSQLPPTARVQCPGARSTRWGKAPGMTYHAGR